MAFHDYSSGLDTNPWKWFVYDDPQQAYSTFRPQRGPRSFMDYWRGQGNRIGDEYRSALGQMALRGEDPNLEYGDFLRDYPWTRRWMDLSPIERGEDSRRFNPYMRYL